MADATNMPVPPPDSGTPEGGNHGKAGFMATTTGKVVVGALALVALLVIVGAILSVFALGGLSEWLNPASVTVTATTVTASTTATAVPTTAAPSAPTETPLTASFTFRNVFAPTVAPPAPPPAETTADSASSGSTSSADTLYLTDIVTEGDTRKGVFVWNGVTYTEGAGGTIGDSPWKVVEVGTDSVLMLYGDTQVTISVGQGISK